MSDLIWSNAISWLACSITLIIHLLKRESLKGKRVAFAPYLFFGVFLFAVHRLPKRIRYFKLCDYIDITCCILHLSAYMRTIDLTPVELRIRPETK